MKTKFVFSLFLTAVIILLLPNFGKAQTGVAYEVTIEQVITNGYLDVSLYITRTSSVNFALATSDFVFYANGDGLDLPDAIILEEGNWTKPPAGDHGYFTPKLAVDTTDDWVKLTIEFKGKSQQRGLEVPNSPTLLGTIRIPISNTALNSEVSWNNLLTIVRMVVPALAPNHPNITALGTFSNPGNFALPVELISFTASAEGEGTTVLNWATASERDNSHFDVEYSINGTEWVVAGVVEGNGTTTARQDYNFTHYNNNSGTAYYRLRQVDYNGQFEYSPVRSVSYTGAGTLTSVNIHPNPTVDRAEISVKGYNGRFNATFFNTTGQQVNVFQGNGSQVIVPVGNMNSGIYIVRITSLAGEVIGTQRLVIGR